MVTFGPPPALLPSESLDAARTHVAPILVGAVEREGLIAMKRLTGRPDLDRNDGGGHLASVRCAQ